MLIIYPTDDWNSFCSLADANDLIKYEVPYDQRKDKWDSIEDITDDLTADEQKEVFLKQSTRDIRLRIGDDNLPDTLEDDLKLATALLANHSVGVDMTNEDDSSNVKVKEIAGVIKKEFFSPSEDKSNDIPDNVEALLKQYDPNIGGGGFKFVRS